MKKEKLLVPVIFIVTAIIIICACALWGNGSAERNAAREIKKCEKQITDFLTAYQMKDLECGKYLSGWYENEPFVEFNGYFATFAEKMKFEIINTEKKGDSYIVHVAITNVDFGAVFEEVRDLSNNQPDSIGNVRTELENRLRAEDAPVKEFEVPVELDHEMKIIMTSEFADALFGSQPQYLIY